MNIHSWSLFAAFSVCLYCVLPFAASGERHISLSVNHSCIVATPDQSIQCLGDNSFGQSNAWLGPFQGVSVGDSFTCGLLMNSSASCMGALAGVSSSGGPPALLLAASGGAASFLDIAAGVSHICGLQRNGTVLCYGDPLVPSPPATSASRLDAVSPSPAVMKVTSAGCGLAKAAERRVICRRL